MSLFPALCFLLRFLFAPRLELIAENLALRQQLALLSRIAKRPKLRTQDRLFWSTLSSLWKNWRSALIIIKPDTVVRWHREGFRNYWRWKSKARNSGRPKIDSEIRELIRRMSEENPLWGAPRIQAELKLLGFNMAESTVAKAWTAQQMIEAFPEDASPRFLLRDRDSIYGAEFCSRVKGMQIEQLITAPHSPWQSPYVERVIGSIRRECLNHLIVPSQEHLRKVLNGNVRYYNNTRPHESLGKNSPIPRVIESAKKGPIISIPEVGGLHHRYQRAA